MSSLMDPYQFDPVVKRLRERLRLAEQEAANGRDALFVLNRTIEEQRQRIRELEDAAP